MIESAMEQSVQPSTQPAPTPAGQGASASSAPIDSGVFEYLLARVEHLARELGRAEGKQLAFERQVARLEQQLAGLEHERRER